MRFFQPQQPQQPQSLEATIADAKNKEDQEHAKAVEHFQRQLRKTLGDELYAQLTPSVAWGHPIMLKEDQAFATFAYHGKRFSLACNQDYWTVQQIDVEDWHEQIKTQCSLGQHRTFPNELLLYLAKYG